jgi:probable HAF family extracellular repeat protein
MTKRQLPILQSIRSITREARPVLLALVLATLAQTTVAQQYQVTFLDDLGGNSRGNSINNRDWIAGFSQFLGNPKRHAALWRDGSILDLGTLGGPDRNSTVAWPVKNNRGIIAGISQTNTPEPNGERWSCAAFFGGQFGFICLGFVWQDGVMTPLNPLPGGFNSFATGANNTGRVVGWAENGVHDSKCVAPQVLQFRPVVWGPALGQIQELPLFQDDTSGAATAINNKGQIVGIWYLRSSGRQAHSQARVALGQWHNHKHRQSRGGTLDHSDGDQSTRGHSRVWRHR